MKRAGLASPPIVPGRPRKGPKMTNSADREVRVHVQVADKSAADATARELEEHGATAVDVDEEGAGIVDPISLGIIVTAVMTSTGFAAWLGVRLRNAFRNGCLIRVTESGEVLTTELPIPYGQVIVIGPDGTWTKYYDVDNDAKLGEMTQALAAGLVPSGGTKTSKEEVDKEAGGDTTASSEPAQQ